MERILLHRLQITKNLSQLYNFCYHLFQDARFDNARLFCFTDLDEWNMDEN